MIPLLVVLAANLFFEEHDSDTLKNLMCVPVKKSRPAIAKLLTRLLFTVIYQLMGGGIAVILAAISGAALNGWGMQMLLTLVTGILVWCAAMPCVALAVWCNKSYIISVIIAFAYMTLGYLSHISDMFVMVPLGLNVATFLPVPMIFRWLYQFHSMGGAREELLAFYNRFSPYFVSTSVIAVSLLTGCTKDLILSQYNHVIQAAGDVTLTDSLLLKGKRKYGVDHYTGTYTADYRNFSKTEYLFGGTFIKRENGKDITVSCELETTEGTAQIFWIFGNSDSAILLEEDG